MTLSDPCNPVRWFSAIGCPVLLLAYHLVRGDFDVLENAVGFATALVLGTAWALFIAHRYYKIPVDG
jgi:hypothetical protein